MRQIRHKLLSTKVESFFNQLDITALFVGKDLTSWNGTRLPTHELINEKGIQFFKSKTIDINSFSTVFINPANHESFIHADNRDHNICRVNYILQGEGKMLWYNLGKNNEKIVTTKFTTGIVDYYIKYEEIESKEIVDVWDGKAGDCALTKINAPHNIITGNLNRVVLSIRINEPFEKLYDILE